MRDTSTPCPKCQYRRCAADQSIHRDICPACGIAIPKWLARQQADTATAVSGASAGSISAPLISAVPTSAVPTSAVQITLPTRRQQLRALFTDVPERTDPLEFWCRVLLLSAFGLWGLAFIGGGIDWERIGGSFMHNINLPFHEFGHVLFMPFGRFMMILGGSLFQVLMPLGLLLAFVLQRRDNFAGSIMLWWSGQSFIDISPYIADAPYRAIPLIRGMGEAAHDWGNLLTMTGSLDSAALLARLSFAGGSALILCALAWGSYILRRQYRRLDPRP